MSGSFTWDAIVRIGTIKPYEKALVITVVHEHATFSRESGSRSRAFWNTVICFNETLRRQLVHDLSPGDLVHFQGFVRTTTFTDEVDAKRRAVDLVITRFDLLHKHIEGPKHAMSE